MKNNRHLSRGVAIVDGKKVFVIGYYVFNRCSKKHYIYDFVPRENHRPFELRTEVISEPDQFFKTIDGVDYFENDTVKWRLFDDGWDGKEFNINKNIIKNQKEGTIRWLNDHFRIKGCKKSIDIFTGWFGDIEKTGNVYGIADGIKEGNA